MERGNFLAERINARAAPVMALPREVSVIDGQMMGGGGYIAQGLCAMSLVELCRMLLAANVSATHLQIFDCAPGASRVPAIFCSIADMAAWQEPELKTHLSGRKKKERPWHAV